MPCRGWGRADLWVPDTGGLFSDLVSGVSHRCLLPLAPFPKPDVGLWALGGCCPCLPPELPARQAPTSTPEVSAS